MLKSSTSCQYYLKAAVLYFSINVIGSLLHPPGLTRVSAKWNLNIDGEIAQFLREITPVIRIARGLPGKGKNYAARHADVWVVFEGLGDWGLIRGCEAFSDGVFGQAGNVVDAEFVHDMFSV